MVSTDSDTEVRSRVRTRGLGVKTDGPLIGVELYGIPGECYICLDLVCIRGDLERR